MARFSASLGPIAWKIASHRIQHALPAGCKFGRGWVGEYEPLPTPILMVNNRVQKLQIVMFYVENVSKSKPTIQEKNSVLLIHTVTRCFIPLSKVINIESGLTIG